MVDEIRLHGMGGQGVVACGELIAIAASYEDKFCRAFPMYGSARRGAPVLAFAQIGDESEATRSMIYYPEYLLVLDPLMPETMDITQGLKHQGIIVFNTTATPDEANAIFKKKLRKIGVIDATDIAVDVIKRPIPNTVMLGAFAKTTGLLKIESIFKAIDKRFPEKLAEPNKKAAQLGYDKAEVKEYLED
ncbi:MAG: 2-oxoacid:acceptor oxidoreductase family protein [Candidatus Bathyarchaeota archaeon]|nr:2-oxoacid:acceptor oxidoreductase family protein [Candidatus Bathyarchaeota archaeon]